MACLSLLLDLFSEKILIVHDDHDGSVVNNYNTTSIKYIQQSKQGKGGVWMFDLFIIRCILLLPMS